MSHSLKSLWVVFGVSIQLVSHQNVTLTLQATQEDAQQQRTW
jgi:hypothetical protein